MIAADETILQDQLVPSSVPGKVLVHYPRGQIVTTLAWFCDQHPPVLAMAGPGVDNGFNQWIVGPNGNLYNPTDRTDAPGCVVLGQDLTPLT